VLQEYNTYYEKVTPISFDVPVNMARIDEHETPRIFYARIKGFQHLDVYKATNAPFLDQPVAIGNWSGLHCKLYNSSGKLQNRFYMPKKVTWQKFLEKLHSYHPTGTHHNVAPEDDDEPHLEWDYFTVFVVLL
jgi:hypothetical protein